MAIDPKYMQGPGGFYNAEDGSGPYAIDGDGNATLIGAGGGGGGSSSVEVTNFPSSQAVTGPLTDTQLRAAAVPVSGPLTNAQLTAVTGTAAQTAVTTDPEASGQTIVALLRGILAEMQAQTALLQSIATNTEPGGE